MSTNPKPMTAQQQEIERLHATNRILQDDAATRREIIAVREATIATLESQLATLRVAVEELCATDQAPPHVIAALETILASLPTSPSSARVETAEVADAPHEKGGE